MYWLWTIPAVGVLGAKCTCYGLFQLSESNLPSYSTTSTCFYTGNMLYKILTILCKLFYNRMWNWKTWFLILFRGVCCPGRSLCHCAFTVAIIYCRYLLFRPLRFIAFIKKKNGFPIFRLWAYLMTSYVLSLCVYFIRYIMKHSFQYNYII
jgi:hypothetical protein